MIVNEIYRGDDKIYELTVKDKQTGLVVDITGCTITMTWREHPDGSIFLQRNFTLTDPTNGVAEIEILAADTQSLTEKKEFFFDVYILKPTGKGETLLKGKFIVELDVT